MNIIPPPQAPEIEKDVLSVLCNRPELIQTVEETLNSDCFYTGEYQFIFDILMEIHLSGAVVSQSALLHRIIPSGRKDILPLYQEIKKYFTSEKSLIRNAEILSEYSTKRALLTKSLQILSMIEGNDPIDEIEREVSEATGIVISRNRNTEAISMSEAMDGLFELMNREPVNGITGIPTGVPLLDRVTGGWEYDDKVIIAARPGMGKTVTATFHSYHSASIGIPTAFFSLEVRPPKLVGRMMANASGFSSSDITKGKLADNQKEIVTMKGNLSKSVPLYFYDNTKSRDINDIIRTIRTWRRKYGIEVFYLDYIGLCRDRTIKDQSNKTAVTESVQGKLSECIDQLGIPGIIFSQLNREAEGKTDKRPSLQNLKSSGKLEEDATRVIFLYRQDYYDYNDAQTKGENFIPSNDIEYIFAKNREGELGPVLLKCDVALNRVYEQPTVEQIQEQAHAYSRNNVLNNIKDVF